MTDCSDKKRKGIQSRQCNINTKSTHIETLCWKPRPSEVELHYAFSLSRCLSLTVNNNLFFFVSVNHDHISEGGVKRLLHTTTLGRWFCQVVNHWLECKEFRAWWWWWWWWRGTVFNRSDCESPWVSACCLATKGFVVGEESLQWLERTKMLWLPSESTQCFYTQVIICLCVCRMNVVHKPLQLYDINEPRCIL